MHNSIAGKHSRSRDKIVEQYSDQQGFFTEKIQIREANISQLKSNSVHIKSYFNKSPFQPKFLSWTGQLKKQPPEALKVGPNYVSQVLERTDKKRTKNMIQDHPYKLYVANENYQLVYSRYQGQPIVNDKFFMNHEVNLQHLGGETNQGLKKIRQFQPSQNSLHKMGCLSFDSKFQSGNLHCAYKNEKSNQTIQTLWDTTNGFIFQFTIIKPMLNTHLRLQISQQKSLFKKKKHSFFKYGCKPAVFSMHEATKKGEGWSRRGKNIIYEQSPIIIPQFPGNKFYSLSFDLTFDQKDDFILIAMTIPYSYTKMINFLKQAQLIAQQDQLKTLEFNIKSLCTTVCGNDIPEVTISRKGDQQKKRMIIIMARQHPGEIWSSFMVQGMIRYLITQPNEQKNWLLENFIFKIFPMVNVDGVIYGNFRCDITGVDLNRRWKDTSKVMYPQIYEIKRKIGLYRSRYKIQVCFDLHGHSKNYNIFCYSCKDNQYTCRLLPLIISKINPVFYFPYCTFGISKYKQTTARAAIYKLAKTQNVLTIETSFFGSKIDNSIQEFGPLHIYKMGEDILNGCRNFLDKKSKLISQAKKEIQTKITQFLGYDRNNQENSGSESDPSGDQIDLETKMNKIFNKELVSIDELKGIKSQRPKIAPIKLKIDEDLLEIKGNEYKKKKISDLVTPNVAMKQIPLYKSQNRTIEEQKVSQINLSPNVLPQADQRNKKTISYVNSKSPIHIKQQKEQSKRSKPSIIEKAKNMSINISNSINSERKHSELKGHFKLRKKQQSNRASAFKQSIGDTEIEKTIDHIRKSDEFMKQYEKFIPISIAMKNRANLTMFQSSLYSQLYNEDQNKLINMMLENKKKIELQKIKRNVQKSTYLVERQGKIKVQSREQKVVDFKSFKQNEKINKQIRKLASLNYYRYHQQ